jgi:hypothetical protein
MSEPSANVYTDMIDTLQKLEQSAARLAGDAVNLNAQQMHERIDSHERAVVFAVIGLTTVIEQLAREAGQ